LLQKFALIFEEVVAVMAQSRENAQLGFALIFAEVVAVMAQSRENAQRLSFFCAWKKVIFLVFLL
jgi:hypothetical protein